MKWMLAGLAALVLAGCEAQAPTPEDVETGEAEGLPPTPDPAQPADDAEDPTPAPGA